MSDVIQIVGAVHRVTYGSWSDGIVDRRSEYAITVQVGNRPPIDIRTDEGTFAAIKDLYVAAEKNEEVRREIAASASTRTVEQPPSIYSEE